MNQIKSEAKVMMTHIWKWTLSLLTLIYNAVAQLSGFSMKGSIDDTKDYNQKEKRRLKSIKDMPGSFSLPFYGSLWKDSELSPLDLKSSLEARHKEYGPISKVEHFNNIPLILLTDAEDFETVIKSGNLRPPMGILHLYRSLRKDRYDSAGIVNVNGEEWQRFRKLTATQIMKSKFIASMIPGVNEIAADCVKLFSKKGPIILNANSLIHRFVAESSFFNMTGTRVGFLASDELPSRLEAYFKYDYQYWESYYQSLFGYPWWKYFSTKVWRDFTNAEDGLYEIVQSLVYEATPDPDTPGIVHYLKLQQLSDKDVRTSIMEFVLGASEPVNATLVLLFYWIAKFDHVQSRLYEELKSVFPQKNFFVGEKDLQKLVYLKACMMEAFRFCPSAPNVARITEQDIELHGYHIPAYSVVLLQTLHSYYQDKNFFKAKEFLPERWLQNEDGKPTYDPHRQHILRLFGAGRRVCPGQQYATMSMEIILAYLFRNFHVKFLHDLKIEYRVLQMAVNSVDVELIEHEV